MWYPNHHQQQQCWNGYIHHLSPPQQQQQHQKQTYSRTSYYCNTDESLNTNQTTTYVVTRNDENESLVHYHPTRVDDVYVTGTDYYVTPSIGSYTDEMSSASLSYQTSNTHWNPVIAAPIKPSIVTNSIHQKDLHTIKPSSSSSSSSSSACWDWLLYPPEIYSHLYIPSSSFIHQQLQQDDDLDLLASLPTWLFALLYPSMKQIHSSNDENDHDQEISSLNNTNNNNRDEPLLSMNIDKKITHVSSNLPLSSENSLNGQQNRSTTPDTDDGYQSASDASRSDYSQQSSIHYDHHNSKDDIRINVPSSLMPKRISYAAAVKPVTVLTNNNKISSSPTQINKTKNNNNSSSLTTNEMLNNNNNNNGQKSKFIAPRFERMHHAKQYSYSTTTNKDSSSSSLTNRAPIRTNNNNHNHNHNHNQRNHIINSSRRR
jgi:hypothetical protein